MTTDYTATDRGDWMQTFTGKAFYPLDPRVEEVDAVDIAHGLSMLCRYGGHVQDFYSVAEHCVLMSRWVERVSGPDDALWALLHDATEAYVGDMVRPLKRSMPTYCAVEDRLMTVICDYFKLPRVCPPIVHEADNRILINERKALMVRPPMPWGSLEKLDPLPLTYVESWSPREVEAIYLNRLFDLQRASGSDW